MSDDAANSADSGTGTGTGGGTGSAAAGAAVPDAEDRKIITLARSARARNGVPEGAAVRDETGRTYVAGTVELDSLKLSALRTAVAMAVASGARSLEAAAVVSAAGEVSDEDRAAVRDLGGAGTPVLLAGPDGTLRTTVTAG
ncbi:cytidine deaminase [Streptomyces sp. NBC_01089]|uniref:cytidine deaminase n=1 Tax=Streptomyces sp. NBC_01089 TaxID=2903747 RepID=UPI00386B2B9C|nr:cytidine deaminase [Streptomyces sp. NBC_01089]